MFANAEILIEKIQALSPERLAQADDFVEFLRLREQQRSLTSTVTQASASAFVKVWDNPDDEAYDAL